MSFNIGDRVRFKEDDLGKWQIFEGTEATVTKVGHPDAPVRVLGMPREQVYIYDLRPDAGPGMSKVPQEVLEKV